MHVESQKLAIAPALRRFNAIVIDYLFITIGCMLSIKQITKNIFVNVLRNELQFMILKTDK